MPVSRPGFRSVARENVVNGRANDWIGLGPGYAHRMGSLPATTLATQFGKYSLVARLATGGMAEIFLARLQGVAGFEKLVCIKRILPHLARDKQFVAMFLDEARIAARISHPNVCQVFELGEIEGSYYIAMEYLEGVPLSCFRRRDYDRDPPDPRLIAGIAVQACEALHHAHQLKNPDGSVMEVVHRDVSPQNLFVTVDGVVKVLDFGIAKIQDATMKTGTGAIKGTYAYMAPEQLRGLRVDRRTDVFALGIVMWETLIGRYLFRRDTEFLTFQAITSEPIEDVAALRPDVPAQLSEVIRKALSRDRDERFSTARQLGEAIAQAIQPVGAPAISEDIARAFPGEFGEQATLIRVARQGGAFSLDVERGPSVGPHTDLATTPSSQRFAFADVSVPVQASDLLRSPAAQPATSELRPARHVSWPLAVAVAAVAIGGVAAWVLSLREPIEAHTTRPAPRPDAAVVMPPAMDAAPAAVIAVVPIDAAPEPPPPDAAPPVDAARAGVRPPSTTPPPPQNRAPGFITIDSSPVYASIYIDGKNYGETPLVHISLPPGSHKLRAVTSSGAAQEMRITIESGKVATTKRIEW
jgi:serine/threonine-protein kinase